MYVFLPDASLQASSTVQCLHRHSCYKSDPAYFQNKVESCLSCLESLISHSIKQSLMVYKNVVSASCSGMSFKI